MLTWLLIEVAWRVVLVGMMIDGLLVSDFHFWRLVLLYDGCLFSIHYRYLLFKRGFCFARRFSSSSIA